MEALHRTGGVPPGWKFAFPAGSAVAGRKVFIDLGCHSCHEVKGEQFPEGKRDAGPELTGVGAHHPAEYFAEAIVNPNSVIIDEPGFTGPDGRSKMPTYNDDLTVTQLIDLVAYLKSLTGGQHPGAPSKPTRSPHGDHR
jgi:mono/diheme cytochrome c family protein